MSGRRATKSYCELSPDSEDGEASPAGGQEPSTGSRLKRRRKGGHDSLPFGPNNALGNITPTGWRGTEMPPVSNTYSLGCDDAVQESAMESRERSGSANVPPMCDGHIDVDTCDFVPDSLEEQTEVEAGADVDGSAATNSVVGGEKPESEANANVTSVDKKDSNAGFDENLRSADEKKGASESEGDVGVCETDKGAFGGSRIAGDERMEDAAESSALLPAASSDATTNGGGKVPVRESKRVPVRPKWVTSSEEEDDEDDEDDDDASEYDATDDSDSEFEEPVPKSRGKKEASTPPKSKALKPKAPPKPKTASRMAEKAKAKPVAASKCAVKKAAPPRQTTKVAPKTPSAAMSKLVNSSATTCNAAIVKKGRGLIVRRPLTSTLNSPKPAAIRPSGSLAVKPRIRVGLSRLARVPTLHPNLKKG